MSATLLPSGNVDAVGLSAGLSSEELARLLELSQGLSGSLDTRQLLAKAVDAARTLLETDMSTLLIPDQDASYLKVAASAGIRSDVARKLATPVGHNLAGMVFQTGMPMRSSDVGCDDRSTLGGVCAGHITSCMLVPMRRSGRVLGVLGVEARERREFTDREESVLQLLANHAATAIQTASLYRAERERADQLKTLLDRLNAQNDVMRRSRDAHDRLAEVALEGLGHDALLRVLVDLVPAPIAVVNQFGLLVSGDAPDGDERFAELWAACSNKPAFGQQLKQLRANVGLAQPSVVADAGAWRTVPVLAAGELLGAIVVLDHERLEELHMVVLEEAASLVAAELLRERSIAEVETRAHGDLVGRLLSADGWGPQAEERAALLGHDLTSAQCVVAVRATKGVLPEASAMLAATRRAAARSGLQTLVGTVDGTFAVILTSGDRTLSRASVDQWIADVRSELAARLVPAALVFGVSPVPCPPGEIADAFSRACQSLAVCQLGKGCDVTHFDDVSLIATLIDITKPDAVDRYVEETIGLLEDYDKRKRTDLAHTLETYLDCSGVARHAAKALYLHPHSLRYRLRRIVEIQGVDLDDPMTRLSTHLALKLRALIATG